MTQLHEIIAVLLEKFEALKRQQTRIEERQQSLEETTAQIFDRLQEAHTRQLLSEAVLSEFIAETSTELDRLSVTIEALKQDTDSDIDQAIINEERKSLKRQLSNLNRHLNKLKEKQAEYGIGTPVHIEIQIEDYEVKINEVINQLESLEYD